MDLGTGKMDRRNLLLAILASAEGRPYTPVQIQKAVFLVCRNAPHLIENGPSFAFEPYDYGPFDAAVYQEADELKKGGDVMVAPSGVGRWNTYAASDSGLEKGNDILSSMEKNTRDYIREISSWVRSQSFGGLVKSIYEAYPEMRTNSVFSPSYSRDYSFFGPV